MASVRTTKDGTGSNWRFTSGQPDALNVPSTGVVSGLTPFIWMTGGGKIATDNPAQLGMDRVLDDLCEKGGYSICEPNTPWLLGNDLSVSRINDAITWARANLGATNDPPILMGVSNGWVCSSIYMRQFPVTGVIGMLPVTAGLDGYLSDDQTIEGYGIHDRIDDAWDGPPPGGDPHNFPARFSPYDDIANYPSDLEGRVIAWYSACDPLFVPQQMSFLARLHIEAINLGATGHLGTFFNTNGLRGPIDQVDTDYLLAWLDRLLA